MPPTNDATATAGGSGTLFSPLTVGARSTPNRIVALPHGQNGLPHERQNRYHAALARGSAGMIVLGGSVVSADCWGPKVNPLYDATWTEGLRPGVEAVHQEGGLIIGQLLHFGAEMLAPPAFAGRWAPSHIPLSPGEAPRAFDYEALRKLRGEYASSAANVWEAGFDGFEVHAAHGYLLHQFLSPHTNLRKDGYGGTVRNRGRIVSEILAQLRESHPDAILGVRVPYGDPDHHSLVPEDVVQFVADLDQQGLIDYVTVSAPSAPSAYVFDASFPPAGMRAATRTIKHELSIARVVISQRIDTPEVAEDVLATGDADLVGLGRPLLVDPEWGRKALAGNPRSIRPCIRTVSCRRSGVCDVNPAAWGMQEPPTPESPRLEALHVVVVGGGPAGCLAALNLAELGAAVALLEARSRLGGRTRLAGAGPHREPWAEFADYLEGQIAGSDRIEAVVGQHAGAVDIAARNPDAVIVATGSAMVSPDLDGLPVSTSDEFLRHPDFEGETHVLVWDETGGWDAINVIETAHAAGVRAVYVTPRERLADTVREESRFFIKRRMGANGVEQHVNSQLAVVAGDLVAQPAYGIAAPLSPVPRRVIACTPTIPVDALAGLVDIGVPTLCIGDALSPRGIRLAVVEGSSIGSRLAQRLAGIGTRR